MNNQINIVYFSATGTTARIVKEIALGMDENFIAYNRTLPAQREPHLSFGPDDIVIIGIPVYSGRIPLFLLEDLKKIKGNGTRAVFVAVYGNRHYDDALLELKNEMEINGFQGVAAGAFIGEHSNTVKVATGRPDAADLKAARAFGTEVSRKIHQLLNQSVIPPLSIPGNYPYKERKTAPPMIPITEDFCTSCGLCARHCPMEAIDVNDYKTIDETKCIHCSSCVKRCPVHAKSIHHEVFETITQTLIEHLGTVYHEPEWFL
ncbi:EFR1 family ferrodoxin [Clostridium sp. E02]|uniref:EFR1 family ferrodoxin n=1 Tax=Clostridium sp. E02 TaxID=2487134 RepID=UPI000F536BAF|nr:EFR1 family ferrodoxin [Clostridium sp. E02]